MFFNSPIKRKTLSDNDIHLWSINPQNIQDLTLLASLHTLLSPSEQEKVLRYRSSKAQHTALITRAFVRTLLSAYTDLSPQALTFSIAKHGKPELINSTSPIKFNLSHNDQLIICAVCLTREIGCDIENTNRKISAVPIAHRYFSAAEYQDIIHLPKCQQQTRFFEYWTLKEAFVKATGKGISQGLDTFSFEIEKNAKNKFNNNITLKGKNTSNWNSYLSYHITEHCIAVCVQNKSNSDQSQFSFFEVDK